MNSKRLSILIGLFLTLCGSATAEYVELRQEKNQFNKMQNGAGIVIPVGTTGNQFKAAIFFASPAGGKKAGEAGHASNRRRPAPINFSTRAWALLTMVAHFSISLARSSLPRTRMRTATTWSQASPRWTTGKPSRTTPTRRSYPLLLSMAASTGAPARKRCMPRAPVLQTSFG